ncbi:MAG: WYL domain-containing protein [Planctomycetota bacterium]|nr:WYL domain-containing protein [Planctomycetota bacterium]
MALPLAKLRLYLSLIPLLRRRPGISFREVGEHLGISAQAAQREIPEALMLCGVPPYLPHDYIACFTEGDKITLRFADQFKRPARLTLQEAAAVLFALRALSPARGSPLATPVAGLMRKIERALGSGEVKQLARRIGTRRRAPGAFGKRIALLEQAVGEQREVEFEYYTQRRRAVKTRRVRPYALIDRSGQYYLIGRDDFRKKELHFRIDRMRSIQLTDATFERPASFQAQRYRRSEMYRPGPKDTAVRVRFAPEAVRFVREASPPEELKERKDGSLERTLRTDSLRWVVDSMLQYGHNAEIVGPAAARAEMRSLLEAWLDFYKRNPK